MSVKAKMTAIADAIRSKTGSTGKLTLDQMAAEIQGLSAGDGSEDAGIIETYVAEEAIRLAKIVQSRQNENTFSFLAISDLHSYGDNADATRAALKHAGQGMFLVRKLCQIDFGVALGDYIYGGNATESLETARAEHEEVSSYLNDAFRVAPQFRLVGNHDNNPLASDRAFQQEELYDLIGSHSDGIKPDGGSEKRGYRYLDLEDKKVRLIFLNTADVDFPEETTFSNNGMSAISPEQLQWLVDLLEELNTKSDASEWSFLLFGHHPADWPNNGCTSTANSDHTLQLRLSYLLDVLNAYVDGGSGSLSVLLETVTATGEMVNGGTVSYDFTNRTAAFIGEVHGHIHNYLADTVGSGFWRFSIPNALPGRENSYAESTNEIFSAFAEEQAYPKTAGTAEDTAFCVVTVDTGTKVIYLDHYGAGYDRAIVYDDTNLAVPVTGISLSATGGTLKKGETVILTATIEPSDATVQSVTWNCDPTSVAVVLANGLSCIVSAVGSGNAVITVTTVDGHYSASYSLTVAGNYTNQIPISTDSEGNIYNGIGYKTGYRINSSGVETVNASTSITGFIPAKDGDVIRTSGIWNVDGSLESISFWDASKTFITNINRTNLCGSNGAILDDSTREMTYTINSATLSKLSNTAYIRIGANIDGNAIVTVNEEIT